MSLSYISAIFDEKLSGQFIKVSDNPQDNGLSLYEYNGKTFYAKEKQDAIKAFKETYPQTYTELLDDFFDEVHAF